MYTVKSTKSGRVLSNTFATKGEAMLYMLELESQDEVAGCYEFNNYEIAGENQ